MQICLGGMNIDGKLFSAKFERIDVVTDLEHFQCIHVVRVNCCGPVYYDHEIGL